MAVDDADLQLDFSPNNHAFNIHSVQYLSKDNGECFLYFVTTAGLVVSEPDCHGSQARSNIAPG